MRLLPPAALAMAYIASFSQAFVMTNCDTKAMQDFKSNGDCNDFCANHWRHQSDKGCRLRVYSMNNCGGKARIYYPSYSDAPCINDPIQSVRCDMEDT